MSTEDIRRLHREFSGTGRYRIRVDGRIDPVLAERLGGLEVEGQADLRGGPQTWLTGPMRDQAELLGILNSVYDMGLSILNVEALAPGEDESGLDPEESTS